MKKGDAMDAPSATTKIEEMILNLFSKDFVYIVLYTDWEGPIIFKVCRSREAAEDYVNNEHDDESIGRDELKIVKYNLK